MLIAIILYNQTIFPWTCYFLRKLLKGNNKWTESSWTMKKSDWRLRSRFQPPLCKCSLILFERDVKAFSVHLFVVFLKSSVAFWLTVYSSPSHELTYILTYSNYTNWHTVYLWCVLIYTEHKATSVCFMDRIPSTFSLAIHFLQFGSCFCKELNSCENIWKYEMLPKITLKIPFKNAI